MTVTNISSLRDYKSDPAATTIGNYALFGGGYNSSSSSDSSDVDAYIVSS